MLATKPNHGAANRHGYGTRSSAGSPAWRPGAPRAAGPCGLRRCGRATAPATRPDRPPRPAGRDRPPSGSAARSPAPRCPSLITRLRSSASTSTRRSRSFAAQSSPEATANAPGAWKRWPSVRLDDVSPWPSSAPSRRSNGTTAPSSRQTMRRSGRTQVKSLPLPQRIDFGHGKRRSSGGSVAGDQRPRREPHAVPSPAPSSRPPGGVAPGWRCACAGSRPAPAPARCARAAAELLLAPTWPPRRRRARCDAGRSMLRRSFARNSCSRDS